jgi:hypothetical protein
MASSFRGTIPVQSALSKYESRLAPPARAFLEKVLLDERKKSQNASCGTGSVRQMAHTKQIMKTLFDLKLSETGVHVVFRPTNSHYFFHRLQDDAGPLSPDRTFATFRMVDPDGYDQHEVYRMALSLASAAANRAWSGKNSPQ